MSLDTFDEFNSTENMARDIDYPPFQFREDQSDAKATLDWLNEDFNAIEEASLSRFIVYRRNHALYKGIHWRDYSTREHDRDSEYSERNPRHTVNFISEMVDTRAAQMARFKTNIALIPSHNEQSDINNAKGCKLLLDSRGEEIDMETLQTEADKIKYKYGVVFPMITWNPEIGPIHPAYEKLNKIYDGDIPSEIKKKIKGRGKEIRIGDVEVEMHGPDRILPELGKNKWKDVDNFHFVEWIDIDQLKADYPSKSQDILENTRSRYDFELMEVTYPKRKILVRTFFHRKTKYLPEGAYIKYTDDVILENKPFPYTDGELPILIDGDIWIYGELWPRSFIGNIEQMQRYYNNIQSAQARDFGLGSSPKWVAPKGACEIHQYNNEFTIMEFRGPTAPQLVRNNPVSDQGFSIQDRLEKKISQQSKVYDITRGEVPQGVTANSALRFLDEQESQRNMPDEVKRKIRVLKTYRMMLVRMAQFYTEDDGRMVRMLGPNNEYLIKSIKKADFSKVYDIRLQNSSALPDTKTGKISTIVDLNMATQTDPVFRKEEIIKMLDLGLDDTFKDEATVAVDAAKQTLEMMLDGEPAPEPKPWDNLMVHYHIFGRTIQSVQFKMFTDPTIQQALLNHVMIIENLMWERCRKNQKFLMDVMNLENYPMIFTLPAPLTNLLPQAPEPPPNEEIDTSKIKSMTENKEGKQ